jgi:hypothetical protein
MDNVIAQQLVVSGHNNTVSNIYYGRVANQGFGNNFNNNCVQLTNEQCEQVFGGTPDSGEEGDSQEEQEDEEDFDSEEMDYGDQVEDHSPHRHEVPPFSQAQQH